MHNYAKPQPSYTDEQLILAARLYFLDGLPQAQIGKMVNVSQSKISRMLALARERGLVRVTVPDYEPRNPVLEKELKETLGVEAVVIRCTAGLKIQDLRQTLGYFAAPVVSSWIAPRDTVAIAGGRTMQVLVEHMKPAGGMEGVRVAQAMGHIDSTAGPYDAAELGRQLAGTWKAAFLTLNTPAILPNAEVCSQLLDSSRSAACCPAWQVRTLRWWGSGRSTTRFFERKVLGPPDIAMLRQAGAVGEILGHFYDADGRECGRT